MHEEDEKERRRVGFSAAARRILQRIGIETVNTGDRISVENVKDDSFVSPCFPLLPEARGKAREVHQR